MAHFMFKILDGKGRENLTIFGYKFHASSYKEIKTINIAVNN